MTKLLPQEINEDFWLSCWSCLWVNKREQFIQFLCSQILQNTKKLVVNLHCLGSHFIKKKRNQSGKQNDLVLVQNVRNEGERRAMGVGTKTPVPAYFGIGSGVSETLIDHHFLVGEGVFHCHFLLVFFL